METKMIRPPAEVLYADELAALAAADHHKKPLGWKLSPQAVRTFLLGQTGTPSIARKFYGDDALVERCIVTLMGNRGLLLVGEPGTAKSMLSELLCAAISGSTTNTIQGTAGTTEDQIRYSWNFALLLSEGPSPRALVPAPVYTGMKHGLITRFEEITRCQPEVQDSLVSLLSDKLLHIPEFSGEEGLIAAQPGFNVLATANLRDRGVNEMSSALKRRFNFETVHPIRDRELEKRLVREQTTTLLANMHIDTTLQDDVLDVLVSTFADLRLGQTPEGQTVERPSTVMSTAEAVAVGLSAGADAWYFGQGPIEPAHIARQMRGTVFKDEPDDLKKLALYFQSVVKLRSKKSRAWKDFWDARDQIGL